MEISERNIEIDIVEEGKVFGIIKITSNQIVTKEKDFLVLTLDYKIKKLKFINKSTNEIIPFTFVIRENSYAAKDSYKFSDTNEKTIELYPTINGIMSHEEWEICNLLEKNKIFRSYNPEDILQKPYFPNWFWFHSENNFIHIRRNKDEYQINNEKSVFSLHTLIDKVQKIKNK